MITFIIACIAVIILSYRSAYIEGEIFLGLPGTLIALMMVCVSIVYFNKIKPLRNGDTRIVYHTINGRTTEYITAGDINFSDDNTYVFVDYKTDEPIILQGSGLVIEDIEDKNKKTK
jgi:hypothetical protein